MLSAAPPLSWVFCLREGPISIASSHTGAPFSVDQGFVETTPVARSLRATFESISSRLQSDLSQSGSFISNRSTGKGHGMHDRKAEIKAFTRQMNLRERLYWAFCSKQKKEAILDIRRQLDQEMTDHISGMAHTIQRGVQHQDTLSRQSR